MKACSLAILIFMSLTACESEEPPTGMPRCEPEGELLVERVHELVVEGLHPRGEGREVDDPPVRDGDQDHHQ